MMWISQQAHFQKKSNSFFPKTIDIGIEHGTVLVLENDEQYEITTFRTESTYQDYRRPDHVRIRSFVGRRFENEEILRSMRLL